MTIDMATRYLGLDLAHPLVASASPITGSVSGVRRVVEAGAAAVVLPSLFEEQIEHDEMQAAMLRDHGAGAFAEATGGYFPELDDYNTGPDAYLRLVEESVRAVDVPVIASLNGHNPGGWLRYAALMEEAGAAAIELNVYLVAADHNVSGVEIEDRYVELVSSIRQTLGIPVAVKVGPYFSSMANMAVRLETAGADGLVLFNRFFQPDFDLEEMTVVPNLKLSSPAEMRLPLRWIAILRDKVALSLAASSGLFTPEDGVKLLLAGADVMLMASALLRHGVDHIAVVRDGMVSWLAERGYVSATQARGSLSQAASASPEKFERVNYMRSLVGFVPHS